MKKEDIETFCPASRHEWRQWLKANHKSKESVWIIFYKKQSGKPFIAWSDAVDEALCFGWVDSKRKPVDEEKFIQFFCKRKSKGTWSKINKDKVSKLIAGRRMTKAGLLTFEAAKQNGSWTILDKVESLEMPIDLAKEFKTKPGSKSYYLSLSQSVKKRILQWIALAKRFETRRKRISEIVTFTAKQHRPKQFQ